MNISDVLTYGYKGTEWTVGETYKSLFWAESNSLKKPSLSELKDKNKLLIKHRIKTEIKEIASKKILEIAPEWEQRNLLSKAILLVEDGQSRTTNQELEFTAIDAVWRKIQAIRTYSDTLEDKVNTASSPETTNITDKWPE